MRHISKPDLGKSARELFELCAGDFTDVSRRKRLLELSKSVETDSAHFENKFPNMLTGLLTQDPMENGVTNNEIVKIYNQKFAKQNSIGRQYYDAIMALPPLGICPICGVRVISTLDHYLPKTKYSTLVVSPNNLIPVCRDCNTDKSDYYFSKTSASPLHPYFDDIDDIQWLIAIPKENRTVAFEVQASELCDQVLNKRVANNFKLYKLGPLYSKKAAQVIADEIGYWDKMSKKKRGIRNLKEYFQSRLESVELNRSSFWQVAFFKGLIEHIDIVAQWL
ncbi:MAG: HNH endonuclease signature motif containing protein [Christensenella sp.]|nr:HNH endonuclease signature motif containing protein [Christensenella sp.]